jgi:hypothetical protein
LFGTDYDTAANGVLDEGIRTLLRDGFGGSISGAVGQGRWRLAHSPTAPSTALKEGR